MNTLRFVIFLFFCNLFTNVARADTLVLVHGWAANADTWVHSGIAGVLFKHGWHDAGVVTATPTGVHYFPVLKPIETKNNFYRVQLPATAPLLLQASHLTSQLVFIQNRHQKEDIIIAGHSAGGIVARLVVVRPEYVRIKSLITIASPQLGTPRVFEGLDVVDSQPFFCPGPGIDFLKTVFGGNQYQYLKDSRGAMLDLAPVGRGGLLDWLNQQPHPDIEYHSVVRKGGDNVVPEWSQDLNQIPALRGRAKVHLTQAAHGLNQLDGELLIKILSK